MIKRTVCGQCGATIEKERLAITDTPLCAGCASMQPGNILQDVRQSHQYTAAELAKQLAKLPPDALVFVRKGPLRVPVSSIDMTPRGVELLATITAS